MNLSPATMAGWAVLAGIGIPVGATMNAGLGRALGHPAAAALVLFVVALSATLAVATATGGWPIPARIAAAPPQFLLGGLAIAFYVASVTVLVPRLGVGQTILFVLAGQVVASAAIDHFGLLGAAMRPLAARRLLGLAMFLAGLLIAQTSAVRTPN